ncbi:MAG: metallophosphoesterase [Zoogloeaceae bacterium]|jgi:predicted MPP superfamily phosphohydrolase|nr:metallophosphoesterase [Zoogloeaceae bacterium]
MSIFTIIRFVAVAVNLYLIFRLYRALPGTGRMRVVRLASCLLAFFCFAAFPLSRVIEGDGFFIRALTILGTSWLAFMFYAFLLLLGVDLVRALNRRWRWRVVPRMDLPRWHRRGCAMIVGAALTICILGHINTQFPVLREAYLPAPPGVAPLKIAVLSDIHLGRLVSPEYLARLVARIQPEEPDLVLFVGDILDDHYGFDAQANREILARLKPPLGIWGVLGNHEYLAGEAEKSLRAIEASGIAILRDAWVAPGGGLVLVGRDDRSRQRFTGTARQPLPTLLATLPDELRKKPMILMDHQPFNLEEVEAADAFLQLSGHTHNGQLFPLNWIIRLVYENPRGHHRRGQTQYWVSSGAGTWGPRIRTNSRPEIVLIHLSVPV